MREALTKCVGVFMPSADQDLDGVVTVSLGAKGVVELELVSSGEKWGRGPAKDIHSSLKAMMDSPAWHLVKALNTLVSPDGNDITIDDYPKPKDTQRRRESDDRGRVKAAERGAGEEEYQPQHWINDLPWEQANVRLGIAADGQHRGTGGRLPGPGGKTMLPHRAVAKMDMRLVPDMTVAA